MKSSSQQNCGTATSIPNGYPRIRLVGSFDELVSTPFAGFVNALCWPRKLPGDFGEIVDALRPSHGITTLEEHCLQNMGLGPAARVAMEVLLEDQRLLQEHGLSPSLECINGYLPVEDPAPVPTDVCSFHVDSAPIQTDTYLCTYHGAASEGLPNEQALRKVDIPETRAALLSYFGGADDAHFLEFLHDHCFDLHYAPTAKAEPYSFAVGNLWRIAVDYPGSPVAPCIHRAPQPRAGQPPRLLLIS